MPPQPAVNPLSLIGIGNAPKHDTSGTDKLLQVLAGQQLRNRGTLATQSAADQGAFARTALPFGLPDRSSPDFDAALRRLQESTLAKRGAETLNLLQHGGSAITDPRTPFTPGDIPSREFTGGAPLPGAAAKAVELAAQAKTAQEQKSKELQVWDKSLNGGRGGYKIVRLPRLVERTQKKELTTKSKKGSASLLEHAKKALEAQGMSASDLAKLKTGITQGKRIVYTPNADGTATVHARE